MKRVFGANKPRQTLRTRDILMSLSLVRTAVARLKGKEYDPLIDIILGIGEEDPIPAGKELQSKLSISPAKLRKWVDVLFDDFTEAINSDSTLLTFPLVEHRILLYGHRSFNSFSCQLPVTPRVGEKLDIPFVNAVANTKWSSFYVCDVAYELLDSVVIITISARDRSSNNHIEYLKDRADFEGWLTKLEQYGMTEYEIEERLRSLYP